MFQCSGNNWSTDIKTHCIFGLFFYLLTSFYFISCFIFGSTILCVNSYFNFLSYTSALTMKNVGENETDLESGRFDKDRERGLKTSRVKVNNQALLSGLAYCLSSCSMILVNKYVLSSYDFNAGISLMLYQVSFDIINNSSDSFSLILLTRSLFWQNFVSVLIVSSLSILGVISTEPLTWRLIKVWLPVNFIFVGMLVTSMFRYEIHSNYFFFTRTLYSMGICIQPVYYKCNEKLMWLISLYPLTKLWLINEPCCLQSEVH